MTDGARAKALTEEMADTWSMEFVGDEPALAVACGVEEKCSSCLTKECSDKVIFALAGTPYGVQEFSRSLKGLVDTSLNLGVVKTEETELKLVFLVRSSVTSKLSEMQETLDMWAVHLGGTSEVSGSYPAWMYRPDSKLRTIACDSYRELFGKEPIITTIHAGLECGLLSGKKPDLDCISFGPETFDIHSVHERLNIASTERTWMFLKKMLANCKE